MQKNANGCEQMQKNAKKCKYFCTLLHNVCKMFAFFCKMFAQNVCIPTFALFCTFLHLFAYVCIRSHSIALDCIFNRVRTYANKCKKVQGNGLHFFAYVRICLHTFARVHQLILPIPSFLAHTATSVESQFQSDLCKFSIEELWTREWKNCGQKICCVLDEYRKHKKAKADLG